MSYLIEKFSWFLKSDKSQRRQRPLKKRTLHLEPLEERQLLSVSQWCDEHFCEFAFCGEEHDGDDALFFDDDMPVSDEAEVPPDIMDAAYSDGTYGPLTFEEYCLATAQDFLLTPWSYSGTSGFPKSVFNMQGPPQTTSGGGSQGSSQSGGIQYAAVFVVDTLLDVVDANDGVTSLREAITSANAVSGTSLITFDASLSGKITLNGTALPTLTKSVDIIGPGSDMLTINGNNQSRMFAANTANTTVTIAGMTLTNGYATTNGGVIYISAANGVLNDLVIKNSQTTGTYGGAIYVTGSDWFVMDNCNIVGNQTPATSGTYGGGAWISYTGDVTISNSIFAGNTSYYGGGLTLYSNGQNQLDNVVIKNNTAYNGGGLYASRTTSSTYLDKANDVTITNSRILSNTSSNHSAGVALHYSENVSIIDSVISGNTAAASVAGGIYFYSTGQSSVSGCTFQDNVSATYGGGIATSGTTSGAFAGLANDLTIGDTTFFGNTSNRGGGMFQGTGVVTITNTDFKRNHATTNGGGYQQNGGTSYITANFLENTAASIGGGAVLTGDTSVMNILQSTFHDNSAIEKGGGIYLTLTSTLHVDATTFSDNTSERGGGLHQAGGTVSIKNSQFVGNRATLYGGGIHLFGPGSVMTIEQSLLYNNISAVVGGGLYVTSASTLNIYNTTISGNKAETANGQTSANEGGGIYFTGTNAMTIVNSTIAYNTAYRGGGLHTTTTNATMHNTIIANNTASKFAQGYDVYGAVQPTSSSNLIGINTALQGITNGVNGNQIGTQSTPIDPRLGPLQNNGGKTKTHALLEDSPAIDAGNNSLAKDAKNQV